MVYSGYLGYSGPNFIPFRISSSAIGCPLGKSHNPHQVQRFIVGSFVRESQSCSWVLFSGQNVAGILFGNGMTFSLGCGSFCLAMRSSTKECRVRVRLLATRFPGPLSAGYFFCFRSAFSTYFSIQIRTRSLIVLRSQ